MKLIFAGIFLVAALRVEAAMVKVVEVVNGRTIAIERNGVRETLSLAGVEILDDARARELLRWTAADAWVMVEQAGDGQFLVYRSPDALFLNRELVLRGFARATLPGTAPELRAPSRYLGEIQPMDAPKPRSKVSAKAPGQKGSGSGPRSPKPRTRRARSPATR